MESRVRIFHDRRDAGKRLAARLEHLRGDDPIVLGLPRGGVPVAAEVARALGAPLDVILVRKLGLPYQPELAMGAIGEGGVRVLNEDVIRLCNVHPHEIDRVEAHERAELERRARVLRGDRPPLRLEDRTVIIIDDGIATGSTARAALLVARAHHASRVILAVPVAAPDTVRALAGDADEIISLETPRAFAAVGQWYDDFSATSEDEVRALLETTSEDPTGSTLHPNIDPPAGAATVGDPHYDVEITTGAVTLPGDLNIPANPVGIVIFVHGSGSSRHSPRNRFVADALNQVGLATLLFDLLTPEEELDRANVFDIELLGKRLVDVTRWVHENPMTRVLPIGYFGASTGAAAALWAAAEPDAPVRAIVSRGGRPDLAGPRLTQVHAATLLIVGSHDELVLELNRDVGHRLSTEHRLKIISGATHLFEEPGTLEMVADLAGQWFTSHLQPT